MTRWQPTTRGRHCPRGTPEEPHHRSTHARGNARIHVCLPWPRHSGSLSGCRFADPNAWMPEDVSRKQIWIYWIRRSTLRAIPHFGQEEIVRPPPGRRRSRSLRRGRRGRITFTYESDPVFDVGSESGWCWWAVTTVTLTSLAAIAPRKSALSRA